MARDDLKVWPHPVIRAQIDLDGWLDAGPWDITVLKPFDVRGGSIAGSGAETSTFSPADHPWLATEFAHVAVDLGSVIEARTPSLRTIQQAVDFADLYGLTPPLEAGSEPVRSQPLSDFLTAAWETRRILEVHFDLQEGGELDPGLSVIVDYLRDVRNLLTRSVTIPARAVVFDVRPDVGLLNLIRLQLFADFAAAREVIRCQRRGCGKLFIWSQGRGWSEKRDEAPRRKDRLRGRLPQFCSYTHAQAELRDLRKEREEVRHEVGHDHSRRHSQGDDV